MTNFSKIEDQAAFNVKQDLARESAESQAIADQAAQNVLADLKGEYLAPAQANGNNVYDGDTANGKRFVGGNTPELKTDFNRGSAMPLSIEARDRTAELISSGKYQEQGSGAKGEKGRDLVNWVAEDGSTIMQQLLAEGYAAPTTGFDQQGRELANEKAYAAALSDFDKTGSTQAMRDQQYDYGTMSADPDAKLYDRRNFAERALARGTDLMQMNYYQFGELMGEVSGVDVMKKWGEEGVVRNMNEAALSPAEIESSDDVDSLESLGIYIVERGLENAPNFLADLGVSAAAIAATVATGGLASSALAPIVVQGIGKSFVKKVGWKAAGKFGLGASMYGQMAGESRGTQLAAGVDSPLLALGTGAANTVLEFKGFQSIVKGFLKSGKITNPAALAKHISKQAGVASGVEGATEFTQGLTNQLAIKMAKPEHEIDWAELRESFFAGAAAGGGTSATLSTVGGGASYLANMSRSQNLDTNTIPETPKAVQAQVNEVGGTESSRDTAIFPQGESLQDITIPEAAIVSKHEDGSTIVTTNPEKAALHKEKGMDAAKELRGYQQSKQEILESGEEPYVVTRKDAEGNELSSELAAESQLAAAKAAAKAEGKPTDQIGVTKAEQSKMLEERQAELSKVDSPLQTQSDVEQNIAKPSPLVAPVTPVKAAPKAVKRQDLTPVPKAEQGKSKLVNAKGELRTPAALMKDFNARAISEADVDTKLQEMGIDPQSGLEYKAVALDRKATIAILLDAGITSDLLMHPKGDSRARYNPYRNAKEILIDKTISNQDLIELAKQQGMAPIVQSNFKEAGVIDKVMQQLSDKSKLPDDVSDAAFLFTNPVQQLKRQTLGRDARKHQSKMNFHLRLTVVKDPKAALAAHLATFDVKDAIDTDARKLDLARVANVLGLSVAGTERTTGTLSIKKKKTVVSKIQRLYEAYDGPKETSKPTIKQKASTVKADAAKKSAAKEQEEGRAKYRRQASKVAKEISAKKEAEKKAKEKENITPSNTWDDDGESSEKRALMEEFRAKAFDVAVVAILYKEAGLTKTMGLNSRLKELPTEYAKLKNWTPEAPELDTAAIRGRLYDYSQSSNAKNHVRRVLGMKEDRAKLVARIKNAKTEVERIAIIKKEKKIELPEDDYMVAELDGVGDPALWLMIEENGKDIIEGVVSRQRRAGNNFNSVATLDPEIASERTFRQRIGYTEVDLVEGTETNTLADDLVAETPGREVNASLADTYKFGAKTPSRNRAEKFDYDNEYSDSTIANTEQADGKNLINVTKTPVGSEGKSIPVQMDAIRLAQMGLGYIAGEGTTTKHTLGDVLRGFYTALDRMGVDPDLEGAEVSYLYEANWNDVSDDVVIHFDKDNKPVTLGEAKAQDRKLNPDNPAWRRDLDKDVIQAEIQPLYEAMYKERIRLQAKSNASPKNTEVKHALRWLDGQLERADTFTDGDKKAKAAPMESTRQALERAAAESAAIRKLSPLAKDISDRIVATWNLARAAEYDDRMGFDQDAVQIAQEAGNIDTVIQGYRKIGEDEEGAPNPNDDGYESFDSKRENNDPDGAKVAAYLGEGVITNERNIAASRAADQRATTAGAPSIGPVPTQPETKAKYKPQAKGTLLGKGLDKYKGSITKLLELAHTKIGLRLPLVVIASSDLNAKALPELDAATITQLKNNMAAGHNGAFLSMNTYGIIVVKDNLGGKGKQGEAATLAVMSHEIGHAIYESMYADNQAILEKAYTKSGSKADLREWIADQVAHHIAANELDATGSKFSQAIAKIGNALIAFWKVATMQLMESDMYMDFSLFLEDATSRIDNDSATLGGGFRTTIRNTNLYNLSEKEVAQKLRATGAKSKQAMNKGWRPITSVLRSVYSRLTDYNKEMSAELYQKSQTKGPQAYEQLQRFLHNDMQSKFAALDKRLKPAEMKQAFNDLRAGKLTANARAVRAAITKVNGVLKAHVPTMHFREDFMAEAFDNTAVEKNREAFEKLLVDAEVATSEDVKTMVQEVLYSDGITDYALAPGKAVSTHQRVNTILSKVGSEKLMAAGFLLDNPHAIMSHYMATGAKRAAWEFKFGGYTDQYQGDIRTIRYRLLTQAGYDVSGMSGQAAEKLTLANKLERKDGTFYSPNHRFNQYLDKIRETHGESGVKATKELLDSAMGRLGNDIPPQLRNTFDWITTWMNLTLLAFSGVASLPELAGSVIRARGQLSGADYIDVFKDMSEMRKFAGDIGIIMTDGASQMALETMGAQYTSPMQHKISQAFFKVNGQQFITNLSRTLALSTGKRFIINAAQRVSNGDTAAVDELGMIHVDAKTVNQWVKDGMPSDNMAINKALNQFVFESSIMPSKFEATKWGNNPYWKLAWHLKQFFYSFGTIIVGGIARHSYQRYQQAVKNGSAPPAAAIMASTPLLIAGLVFLPLAGLSEELRQRIKGKDRTGSMSDEDYAKLLISKTGGLGPFEMISSMYSAYAWNNSPIAALTPTTGFIETIIDGDISLEKKLRRITPFMSQGALGGLYDQF